HRKLKHHERGDTLKYARRYFKFGPNGPNDEQRNTMLSILVLTMNGLYGDKTIVLEDRAIGDGVMGWTSSIYLPEEHRDQLVNMQNQQPELRTHYDTTTGQYVSFGNIYVSKGLVKGPDKQGLVTIIHEATHRYANTLDFDERGYSRDGVD